MEDGLEQKIGGGESEGEIELRQRLLREAFGDDSSSQSSDDIDAPSHLLSLSTSLSDVESDVPKWESVNGINGLWLCSNFLSLKNQVSLISDIYQEGWFSDEHNQAMRFGDLPEWALELSRLVRVAVCEHLREGPLLFDLLWREPLFDQLITNVYKPGEGICSHVDLLQFEDGIAIISLESSCIMQFTHTKEHELDNKTLIKSVPVYLKPGSLVLMHSEARYFWKHGINRESDSQIWEGEEIEQKRRTSVTLRKLCTVSAS